jgi:dTMP kinase
MSVKRGALIVFEGCDRAGKTTQCKKLVDRLKDQERRVKFMNFPNRTTQSGMIINNYLQNKENLTDEGIHLLFSVNRWEVRNEMERELMAGTTIIVDRYSYSGVAYSAAKGLDFEWCKTPEKGLLKPDLVIYLTLTAEAMTRRGGFGTERYETTEMQRRVGKMFERMIERPLWQVVNADKTEEDLSDELEKILVDKIDNVDDTIGAMW